MLYIIQIPYVHHGTRTGCRSLSGLCPQWPTWGWHDPQLSIVLRTLTLVGLAYIQLALDHAYSVKTHSLVSILVDNIWSMQHSISQSEMQTTNHTIQSMADTIYITYIGTFISHIFPKELKLQHTLLPFPLHPQHNPMRKVSLNDSDWSKWVGIWTLVSWS